MDLKKSSYTAASAFPFKIFKNIEVLSKLLGHGQIIPVHAQVLPTNRCNLSCEFCSCRNRSKNDELAIADINRLAKDLAFFSCEAITITGGGEPLMHKDIEFIIQAFLRYCMQVGLVTNGLLLDRVSDFSLKRLTWCRISCSDDRKFSDKISGPIKDAYSRASGVDWAFSYVISKNFDGDNFAEYVKFANKYDFTHVRAVSDICDLASTIDMEYAKQALKDRDIDDSRVIYQGRKSFSSGNKDCYISLLKPVIGADGYVYPCCGAQYAHENQDLDLTHDMRMGHMSEIKQIYKNQKWFNGSVCYRCYYKDYNDAIGALKSDIKHERFV